MFDSVISNTNGIYQDIMTELEQIDIAHQWNLIAQLEVIRRVIAVHSFRSYFHVLQVNQCSLDC